MSIAEPAAEYENLDLAPWTSGSALESGEGNGERNAEKGYGYDEDEGEDSSNIMASGASDENGTASSIGGDGGELSPVPTQETREWTEEDDIRMDYHEALRGL